LRLGTPAALAQAIAFVAGDGRSDRARCSRRRDHDRQTARRHARAHDRRRARQGHADDPAFEPLLPLGSSPRSATPRWRPPAIDVDAEIHRRVPSFGQMTKLSGFDAMIRSLRTAESLYQSTGDQPDGDLSPPITLWMKVLENYVHAWLGPRMCGCNASRRSLFTTSTGVIGASWPGFQRWLEPKWRDPAEVGGAKVEIPLRAIPPLTPCASSGPSPQAPRLAVSSPSGPG